MDTSNPVRVLWAAELGVGDIVRTPLGREATVRRHTWHGRVELLYIGSNVRDLVVLRADCLVLVRRAARNDSTDK